MISISFQFTKFQLPPSSLLDSAKEQAANNKKEKSVSFQTASPTPPKIPSSGVLKQPASQKNQKVPQFTTKTVIIEERNGHASPTAMEEVPKRSTNLQQPKSPPPPSPQQQQQQQQQNQQESHTPATHIRPESPSPDYSNSPSPSPSPPRIRSPPMGGVDMESLESFRLKNPPKNVTKPPPFYFNEAAMHAAAKQGQGQIPNLSHYTVGNGMDDKMVRMAAYPSAYSRPEPSRLGFIGKGPAPMVPNGVKTEVILHRELEDALSRCNLNGCNSNAGGGNSSSNAKMMMHHNQCQSQNSVQHHQNDGNYCNGKCSSSNGANKTGHHHQNGKPNGGGILKISNGNNGGGNSSSNKTISFGGRY